MKRRPGAIPGRLLLCFIRKGVLQAFYGLLLFGGILTLPPILNAVWGVLMGFAAVLWYRVLGRYIAALFFLRFFGLIWAA